jgi:gluconolactonase
MKYLLIGLLGLNSVFCQETLGELEFLDNKMHDFFSSDAKIEVLASGFKWAEGPVWVPELNGIVFTDVPNNKAFLWKENNGVKVFLDPSGMTNHAPHSTNEGANGLALDSEGNLILCQHGDRAVSRLKKESFNIQEFEILVDHYQGKWLNSPNDLAFNQNGELFFTDPPYGLQKQDNDPIKELGFNGIYKWSQKDGIKLLDSTLSRPNGIALSKDEKTVYVGNSDSKKSVIYSFDLINGMLENKQIFFDGTELGKYRKGLFDGLKVHSSGIIFATGPGGVLVIDKTGKHLGTVMPGNSTANCTFDSQENYLYLTATNVLARIKLK